MMYGIEDEPELIHLLGYLTKEQWLDSLENFNQKLDVGRIEDFKQEVEKFYGGKND